MSDFPRTVKGPMFKEPIARKVRKGLVRKLVENEEVRKKREVRLRDKYCRFPLCGCGKFKLALHVSHSIHKGMGGNPTGDRSDPALMVLVCSARHRENRVSIDKGTLRWEPLTERGADGLIRWLVDMTAVRGEHGEAQWLEVAHEASLKVPRSYSPLGTLQRSTLETLSEMTI